MQTCVECRQPGTLLHPEIYILHITHQLTLYKRKGVSCSMLPAKSRPRQKLGTRRHPEIFILHNAVLHPGVRHSRHTYARKATAVCTLSHGLHLMALGT